MIESIDFLPADYHRRRQRSRKTYWRSAVFFVFILLVGAGAVRRHLNRCQLEATRDRLQRQADRMVSQLQSADALKAEIRRLETRSAVIAMLRYRAASTGILQAVTNTLPRYTRLARIQLGREKITKQIRSRVPRSRRTGRKSGQADKSSQQLDLEQLKTADRDTRLFVTLEGIAPDDVAISQYLAALEATGVPQTVQLLFTDRYVDHGLPVRRFEIRLRVRRVGSTGPRETSPAGVSVGLYRPSIQVRKQRP